MASSTREGGSDAVRATSVQHKDLTGNTRLQRFNEALEKFLELIDERATKENFQTALPHVDPKVLDGARTQFVFHLKDAIKLEKDRLVESYALDEQLAELEGLTREADAWNEQHGEHDEKPRDAWRPGLDFATALAAPSILVQRETNAALEVELRSITEENRNRHTRLAQTLADASERRENARSALDTLDETIAGLEMTPEQAKRLRDMTKGLFNELGPRGVI